MGMALLKGKDGEGNGSAEGHGREQALPAAPGRPHPPACLVTRLSRIDLFALRTSGESKQAVPAAPGRPHPPWSVIARLSQSGFVVLLTSP